MTTPRLSRISLAGIAIGLICLAGALALGDVGLAALAGACATVNAAILFTQRTRSHT